MRFVRCHDLYMMFEEEFKIYRGFGGGVWPILQLIAFFEFVFSCLLSSDFKYDGLMAISLP